MKQTQVHSLRAKNAQCDDREWEKILEALLKQDQNESFGKDISSDIEMVASVQEGHSITMTIRKHVQGITVSFSPGTSTVPHAPESTDYS